MAKLIYVANVSLDGYIEDEHGSFDWTAPDDELRVPRPPLLPSC
jgi:dihydrofolate reductase